MSEPSPCALDEPCRVGTVEDQHHGSYTATASSDHLRRKRRKTLRDQQAREEVIVLEGGNGEGDWDDFDFTLEALPIPGRLDPGPGSYGRSRKASEDHRLPWCRWVVSAVGFWPPRGRSGPAQLAGLAPGDLLTHVVRQPNERVEAGLMGRECMGQELARLAQWSRAVGPGIPPRKRFLPRGRHEEGRLPWRLEFRRQPRKDVATTSSRAGNVESNGGSRDGHPGRRRPLPLSRAAFLVFRVFHEHRWTPEGGRVSTVRVLEEHPRDTGRFACPQPIARQTPSPSEGVRPGPAEIDSVGRMNVNAVAADGGDQDTAVAGEQTDQGSDGELDADALLLLGLPTEATNAIRRRVGLPPATLLRLAEPCLGYDSEVSSAARRQGPGLSECPVSTTDPARALRPERVGQENGRLPTLQATSDPQGRQSLTHPKNDVVAGARALSIVGERVVVPLVFDQLRGGDTGCEQPGERRDASSGVHLLEGLAPDAVRLVKERIFAEARVVYASVYGLLDQDVTSPHTLAPSAPGTSPTSGVQPVVAAPLEDSVDNVGCGNGSGDALLGSSAARQAPVARAPKQEARVRDDHDLDSAEGVAVAPGAADSTAESAPLLPGSAADEKGRGQEVAGVGLHPQKRRRSGTVIRRCEGAVCQSGVDSGSGDGIEKLPSFSSERPSSGASGGNEETGIVTECETQRAQAELKGEGDAGAMEPGEDAAFFRRREGWKHSSSPRAHHRGSDRAGIGEGAADGTEGKTSAHELVTARIRQFFQSEAFLSWVRVLKQRSGHTQQRRLADSDRDGNELMIDEERRRRPLCFTVGLTRTVVKGKPLGPSRHADGLRPTAFLGDYEAESSGALAIQHVTIPAFPGDNSDDAAGGTQTPLRRAVMDTAVRFLRPWTQRQHPEDDALANDDRSSGSSGAGAGGSRAFHRDTAAATAVAPESSSPSSSGATTEAAARGESIRLSSLAQDLGRQGREDFSSGVMELLRQAPAQSNPPSTAHSPAPDLEAMCVASGRARSTGKGKKPPTKDGPSARETGERKCNLCRRPLASMCECSAGAVAIERKLLVQEMAKHLDSSLHGDLGVPKYKRINSRQSFKDSGARHRVRRRRIHLRYDQAVSLQHRGLLRLPFASSLLAPKRKAQPDEQPTPGEVAAPAASSASGTINGEVSPEVPVVQAPAAGESTCSAAATAHPTVEGFDGLPLKLEKWPGFPTPSKAFAPAAPMENPRGSLPPSPQLLRYIHQMASMKVHGNPGLYGRLDESALLAVGVLVEEMMEELISPLVDGRTKGFKHLTPDSLTRELNFMNRRGDANPFVMSREASGRNVPAAEFTPGKPPEALSPAAMATLSRIFGETPAKVAQVFGQAKANRTEASKNFGTCGEDAGSETSTGPRLPLSSPEDNRTTPMQAARAIVAANPLPSPQRAITPTGGDPGSNRQTAEGAASARREERI